MLDDYPEKKPSIKSKSIGGETLLIDGEQSYAINPAAAFVWQHCDGVHTIEDIEQEIRSQVRISAEKNLHAEITVILEYFRKHDLLINEYPAGNANQQEINMARQDHTGYELGKFMLDEVSFRMLIELAACDVGKPLPRLQVDWDELLKAIQYHRVTGLVYGNLLKRDDPDYPPPHFQEAVIRAHRWNALQMIKKCEMVKDVLTRLSELGIEVVVLKGPAVAHAYYPQAPLRYFIDLDLFGKMSDRGALAAGLNELGYELEAGYVEPMPKLIPSVITHHHTRYEHSDTRFPVEIHWEELLHDDLVPRDLDGMWRRAVSVNIEGVHTKTLSLEDHLLHLCAHAHHHRFDRLFRLTDLLFILRDHNDEINWELFINLVSLEEAQTPVFQSFSLVNQMFGFELPKWVLVKLKPDGFRRWWHKHFFTPKVTLPYDMQEEIPFSFKSTPWFQSTVLNLMIMGRRPEKLHYLLRLLFPTPEWLRLRFNLPPDRSLLPYYILRLLLPSKLMERLIRN